MLRMEYWCAKFDTGVCNVCLFFNGIYGLFILLAMRNAIFGIYCIIEAEPAVLDGEVRSRPEAPPSTTFCRI